MPRAVLDVENAKVSKMGRVIPEGLFVLKRLNK